MKRYVADTHALHWYLTGSPKLGARARTAFDEAAAGGAVVHVSVITLAELFYLNQKVGQVALFAEELRRLHGAAQFVLDALLPDDVPELETDAAVPEMHDRLIVGLARRKGAVCLTRDPEIAAAGVVPTLW